MDESIDSRSAFYSRHNPKQHFQRNHQQLMQEYQFRLHQKQQPSKKEHDKTTNSDSEQTSTTIDRLQCFLLLVLKNEAPVYKEARAKNCIFENS